MRKGFTLVELLIIVAIIGVLSSVVLASLNAARARARDSQRQQDIVQVNRAILAYYADNGAYPSTGNLNTVYMDPGCKGATAPDQITANWVPGLVAAGYIKVLPRDPYPYDQVFGSGANASACYMYSSDGRQYILSAWTTVEKPITGGGLYSLAGYREANWNAIDATYMCNYQGGPLPAGSYFAPAYQRSYTITNVVCP